jgi:hypothetical protein
MEILSIECELRRIRIAQARQLIEVFAGQIRT